MTELKNTQVKMKRALLLIFSAMVAISMTACYSSHHRHGHRHGPKGMPPGHAKKYYGEKSAKEFAPGQQKKRKHRH